MQVALAQNITVENFQHHKHYFWQINSNLPLDKKNAIVVLQTEDKDFNFSTSKGVPIETVETDEGFLLKVPDKTKYILITHPDMGDYTWRVPEKYLKKHNYYSAELVFSDLTKEYKNHNQWIVFNVSPENSILTMDSVMHRINNGIISLYLPVGPHTFTLESPFYESLSDSISLTDSVKIERNLYLKPLYSYLTVIVQDAGTEIFVDENFQGVDTVTVGRINEGKHRVSLLKNNHWVKDTLIDMARAEKKTLKFPENFKPGYVLATSESFNKHPSPDVYRELSSIKSNPDEMVKRLKTPGDSLITAPVRLIAEDSLSMIFIDREMVAHGEWEGSLPQGTHFITTEKDGIESVMEFVEINDSSPREINLAVPKSSKGKLNIHSNVVGAEIFIGKKFYGLTPLVLEDLNANETFCVTLHKEGYKDKKLNVTTRGNEIIEVLIELKKK